MIKKKIISEIKIKENYHFQLFINKSNIHKDLIKPIKKKNNEKSVRPNGGLWVSTFNPIYGSHWYQYLVRESLKHNWLYNLSKGINKKRKIDKYYYLICLDENSSIFHINNIKDVDSLYKLYGKKINYELMAQEFDGLHLTLNGLNQCNKIKNRFSTWDSEATFIINPNIVKEVKKIPFDSKWDYITEVVIYDDLVKKWIPLLTKEFVSFCDKYKNNLYLVFDNNVEIYTFLKGFHVKFPQFKNYWYNFSRDECSAYLRSFILLKYVDYKKH